MITGLRKIFNCFDFIAHPAGGWWRSETLSKKRESSKKASIPQSSPESYNVRGRWGKKAESPRRSPAP